MLEAKRLAEEKEQEAKRAAELEAKRLAEKKANELYARLS